MNYKIAPKNASEQKWHSTCIKIKLQKMKLFDFLPENNSSGQFVTRRTFWLDQGHKLNGTGKNFRWLTWRVCDSTRHLVWALFYFWWSQLAAGRSLKFTSYPVSWDERSCPRSATAIHSVARGSNTKPSNWEANTLPKNYHRPQALSEAVWQCCR